MLSSILGLHSRFSPILNPHYLTLTLLPSDSDKSPITPRESSQPSSPNSRGQDDGPSPKALAAIFALTGTLGVAAMTATQSLSGYLLLLALFGPTAARSYMREFIRADVSLLTPDQLAARASMARSPRYAAFLVLFTTLSAGLPEELLKYLPVLWLQRKERKNRQLGQEKQQKQQQQQQQLSKRAAVKAATAASLGFALVELVGYAMAARGSSADRAPYAQASRTAAAAAAGPSLTVIFLERIFVSLPGHIATAILSASRGADAEAEADDADDTTAGGAAGGPASGGGGRRWWRRVLSAVGPSVLYHGLFDLVLFGASAWAGGHVGWVHPVGTRAVAGTLGLCVCVQGVLYAHTLRAWLG